MAQHSKLDMYAMIELRGLPTIQRPLIFMGLSLLSALALAQTIDRMDPNATFDTQHRDEIFNSAGKWRQAPPAENQWRSIPDETVPDRRFHFGSNSAHEEMQYRNDNSFRDMGSLYDDYQPSSMFRYNF